MLLIVTVSATFSGSTTDVKERTLEGFGVRLAAMRQARGLTQDELGAAVGISNRMIAYYERDDAQPPGAILVELARTLKVSTDELLGVKPLSEKTSPKTARLLKRLRRVEELPPADQCAVLKLVDAMLETAHRASREAQGELNESEKIGPIANATGPTRN